MYTIAVDIGGTFTDVVAIDGAPWPFLRIDRTPG